MILVYFLYHHYILSMSLVRFSTVLVFSCLFAVSVFFPNELRAQQNLFNIPSGDMTPKGTYFYQHQFNIYSADYMESKSHFVWGLGNGFDAGINLINVKLNPSMQSRLFREANKPGDPLSPLFLATVQKQFTLSDNWQINIGTQAGLNTRAGSSRPFTHFTYGLVRWDWNHKLRVVGGVYNTDQYFVGRGQTSNGTSKSGFIAGFELPLSRDWFIMCDYVSGNHPSAVSVLGGMVNVSKRVQICAGYLLPNSGASSHGIVLELNLLGFDAYGDGE